MKRIPLHNINESLTDGLLSHEELLTKIKYLDNEYLAVKLKIKDAGGKEQTITIGSTEMYKDMIGEDDKLKGEDAVKINGDMTGYIDITDDTTLGDIKDQVEKLLPWATIVSKIDEGIFDRLRARVHGAVAGAKTGLKNTVGKAGLKAKAAIQGVAGAANGDFSKAQATLDKANASGKDVGVEANKAKAKAIMDSIYTDLKKLYPGVDVTSLLHDLMDKLESSVQAKPKSAAKPVAQPVKKKGGRPVGSRNKPKVVATGSNTAAQVA